MHMTHCAQVARPAAAQAPQPAHPHSRRSVTQARPFRLALWRTAARARVSRASRPPRRFAWLPHRAQHRHRFGTVAPRAGRQLLVGRFTHRDPTQRHAMFGRKQVFASAACEHLEMAARHHPSRRQCPGLIAASCTRIPGRQPHRHTSANNVNRPCARPCVRPASAVIPSATGPADHVVQAAPAARQSPPRVAAHPAADACGRRGQPKTSSPNPPPGPATNTPWP